jgi:alanyl-tRNA synthetase
MPTQRLYYDDSYLRSFTAHITRCVAGANPAAYEVVLDRTAFYPTSGGQPNDLGTIGDANVVDVRDDGDEIVHVVDRELPLGEVQCAIDWARRFDHMQQHTGQHVLSAVFQGRYKLPTVSFHLGAELCTIDLRGREPSGDTLVAAQNAANALLFENRAVAVRYGTADELVAQGVRKEVEREGTLRAVEIESADLQPCGGTHMKRTGEIGVILVRRCTKIRQDWRVEFACGDRAARLASSDFQLLRNIGERLSCAPEEAVAAIDKAMAEREAHFKELKNTLRLLSLSWARDLLSTNPPGADGSRPVTVFMEGGPAEMLLPLATELVKTEGVIALLVHAVSGQLVFAQHASAGKDLAASVKELFASIPGKGGGKRDFVRAQLADASRSAEALALAQKIILG